MRKEALLLALIFFITGCQYVARHSPPQSPNLVKLAKEELKKGDCERASLLLKKDLKRRGDSFQALFWLGVSEAMCKRYGKAYRYLQKSLGYAPSQEWTGRVYATTGFVFHLLKKEREASIYFKLADETSYPTKLLKLFNEGKLSRDSGFKAILSWM